MHPNKAQQILSDPDTLDIGQTAEAVQEINRTQPKRPKSKLNSIRAHIAWRRRTSKDESLRQKFKEVWNKKKKI